MLDRETEVKALVKRVKTLVAYLTRLKAQLEASNKNDLHLGVLTAGRILNSFVSRFEFDHLIEHKCNDELNSMIVRAVSTDYAELNRIRDVEIELIERMITSVNQRLSKARSEVA